MILWHVDGHDDADDQPRVAVVVALRVRGRGRRGRAADLDGLDREDGRGVLAVLARLDPTCDLTVVAGVERLEVHLRRPVGDRAHLDGERAVAVDLAVVGPHDLRHGLTVGALGHDVAPPGDGRGRDRGERRRGREVELDARERAVVRALVLGRDGGRDGAVLRRAVGLDLDVRARDEREEEERHREDGERGQWLTDHGWCPFAGVDGWIDAGSADGDGLVAVTTSVSVG